MLVPPMSDADLFRMMLRQEQNERSMAADEFAAAAASGDPERFLQAVDGFSLVLEPWGLALHRVPKVENISPAIRQEFLSIWVQHKGLGRRVPNRGVMLKALRALLPNHKSPRTESVTLYRGASVRERLLRRYGFSWTTDIAIARAFAGSVPNDGAHPELEGVVLSVSAAPSAILYERSPEGWYDEGEIIVDPFKLTGVKLEQRGLWKE